MQEFKLSPSHFFRLKHPGDDKIKMFYFEMAVGVSMLINYIDLEPVWPLLGNVTGFRSYTRLVSNELKPNDLPDHPIHLCVSRCDAATVDASNV